MKIAGVIFALLVTTSALAEPKLMELRANGTSYSFNEYNITKITLSRIIPPTEDNLFIIYIKIHERKIPSMYEFIIDNVGREVELFICGKGILARRFEKPGTHEGNTNFVAGDGEIAITTQELLDFGWTIEALVKGECN